MNIDIDATFGGRVKTFPNRAAWRAHRRSSIGGSSIKTVAGLNPFELRDELWSQMSGLIEPDNLDGNQEAYWGTRLEPILLQETADEFGCEFASWNQLSIVIHRDHGCIHDTPDGLMVAGGEPVIMQVKTTSAYLADRWKDEPPLDVFTQVQHEMEVLDLDRAVVGVLIGGQDFRTYSVPREREAGEWLILRAIEFLGWVRDGVLPPHDSRHPMTVGLAKRIWTTPEKSIVALDPGLVQADNRRSQLDGILKAAAEERGQINERIRRAMGPNDVGMLPNGVRYKITSNGQMRRKE